MPGISEQTAGIAQDRGNAYVSVQTASFSVDTTTAPLASVNGTVYTISNAGATTATFPSNTTVAYPIGYKVVIASIGAGTCTVTAGAGATLQLGSAAAIATVTSRTVTKVGTSAWLVSA